MSADKKEPEIRFKGFSGEWEKNTLSEIANVIDPHPSHRAPDAVDNGIPFIGIGDISDVGLVDLKNVRIVPSSIYSEHSARYTIENGDFAYGRVASVGKIIDLSNNVGYEYTYSPTMAIVKPTIVYSAYLRNYLQTEVFKDLVANKTSGSTRKSLGVQDFRCLPVLLPLKEEQIAIGNYFQKLDTLINQHQQKHDKLSNLKKSMLEKMFPKHGETIPEIRFKGFSGEWEETVLSEIADKYDNFRIAVTAKDRIAGNTPYYGANGIQDYVDGYTHDGEYILLAEDGANDLKNYPIHYVNGKVWINNHAHVLKAKENGSNIFLKYALNNIEYEPFLVGGGRAKLNASIMMNLVLTISTDIKEQAAIGNFLQKLDTLINQHQQQITKLNNIKQACLSKIFV